MRIRVSPVIIRVDRSCPPGAMVLTTRPSFMSLSAASAQRARSLVAISPARRPSACTSRQVKAARPSAVRRTQGLIAKYPWSAMYWSQARVRLSAITTGGPPGRRASCLEQEKAVTPRLLNTRANSVSSVCASS